MRVPGDADAQLPEQPRGLERGGPGGSATLVLPGGGSLCGGGLGLALRDGAGAALPGSGGEAQVGAHDVGGAGRRVVWLARR